MSTSILINEYNDDHRAQFVTLFALYKSSSSSSSSIVVTGIAVWRWKTLVITQKIRNRMMQIDNNESVFGTISLTYFDYRYSLVIWFTL